MNIALFDNAVTLGGAQRFLLDLAGGLLARRYGVVVLVGGDGPLQHACRRRDVPVIEMPLPAAGDGWAIVPRLASFFRREGIRRLYANSAAAALYGGLAVRLAGGRACWRLYHAADIGHAGLRARITARLSAQVQVVSPSVADEVRALVGQRAAIRVAPPAIDLTQFSGHDPPLRKRGEKPVVGMVGSWEPLSGQEVLVKAFRLLQEGGCTARLRLASLGGRSAEEDRYRSVVQSAAKAAGLADRVIIEGEITDLPGFVACCDVLAAPSLRATSGRIALEAAAAGRPVIASRLPGLNEVIEDGHTGLLAPGNHPHALADALALLLASPALRLEMGRQARLHVEQHFNLETLLDTLEEHFLGHAPKSWATRA